MTLHQIIKRLQAAHVPDVHRITGIPLRTLYRLRQGGRTPAYQTVLKLDAWATRQPKARAK